MAAITIEAKERKKERDRQRYLRNREAMNQKSKEYQKKHYEKVREYQKAYRMGFRALKVNCELVEITYK